MTRSIQKTGFPLVKPILVSLPLTLNHKVIVEAVSTSIITLGAGTG